MSYEAFPHRADVHRLVLEKETEGVYVFIYTKADSPFPEYDYLQDDFEAAMRFCEKRYGVAHDQWRSIPPAGGA